MDIQINFEIPGAWQDGLRKVISCYEEIGVVFHIES